MHRIFAGRNPLVSCSVQAVYTLACDVFLWCVQEVAGLKKEDIISPTAGAGGVSGDRTLSELQFLHRECPCYYVLITAENDLVDVLAVICDLHDWRSLESFLSNTGEDRP